MKLRHLLAVASIGTCFILPAFSQNVAPPKAKPAVVAQQEKKAEAKPKPDDRAKPEVKADTNPKVESPPPAEVKPSAKVECKENP